MATNGEMLKHAIINKLQVQCYYDGYYREMCPHAIGWKGSVYHVLSYQFAGQSSRQLPAAGQWKCMDVNGISQLRVMEGAWYTGTNHTRPQNCIDAIEVEVSY